MSKNIKYEEYSSKCLSGVDDEGHKVTHHTEKRITRTTSNLSDDFLPRNQQYKHNESFDDDVSSLGPSASRVNSRLSDAYHVSYPPTERSNIKDEDLVSNYSERTQNLLDDFDLDSFTEDYNDVTKQQKECDDDVFSVLSRKSNTSSNSSRSKRRNVLKLKRPIEGVFDEKMEDLARGFHKTCSLRENILNKRHNVLNNNLMNDDDFGLMQHSSMFSDAFTDDFFRDTVGILGKKTTRKSQACNSSFGIGNECLNSQINRFKIMQPEDNLSYCNESGIFSETSDKTLNQKCKSNECKTFRNDAIVDDIFCPNDKKDKRISQEDDNVFKLSIDVTGFK